jgi:hypothetical protein
MAKNLMKIPPLGVELFHAKRRTGRQTDRQTERQIEMTEIIVENGPKNGQLKKPGYP